MNNELFEKASKIFYNIAFVKTIGVKLISVEDFSAVAEFKVGEHILNYVGGLHGGAVAGVMDTIVFFPGKLLPSGLKLTTSGLDVKFFKTSAKDDIITVKAEIVHFGRRRINVDAEAFIKESGKIIARANVDLMTI